MIDNRIKAEFQEMCIRHLQNAHYHNKHLFYEHLPIDMISTGYDAKITVKRIEWKEDAVINNGMFEEGIHAGTPFHTIKQSCKAWLMVTIKTLIYFPIEFDIEIEFEGKRFIKNGDLIYETHAHTNYSKTVDQFQRLTWATQRRFGLTTIGDQQFDNKRAFSFFTDITRRNRSIQPSNDTIEDNSYLEQLEQAHGEIAVHISQLLTYLPFVGDLLQRRIIHDGDEIFLPNITHYSYQFFMTCTCAFERLYTFWETLVVLPFNYDNLGFSASKTPSFGQYFGKLQGKIQNQHNQIFDPASQNLQWLMDFFNGDYKEIINYRHRFVHHAFTTGHEGLLSAKFSINAYENVGNKARLQELNAEIKGMPSLLIKHFHHCVEGFKRMLYLIDELA